MLSGHIMIEVLAGFAVALVGTAHFEALSSLPVFVNILLNIFKVIVCALQAYVFSVLSCIYLSESMEKHTEMKGE